jgi:purine-binding chemotaxis protein CheW
MSEQEKQKKIDSYLIFKIGEEQFGAHVGQVLNILEMTKITAVPKSPDYMKGVINLRGMVLPVIDTRIKFALPETEYTNNTCIIVMDLELEGDTIHIGAIVDSVVSVIEIDDNQIEPPPSIGDKYRSEFIYGMAKVENEFIMLLDMQKVLSSEEIADLATQADQKSLITE